MSAELWKPDRADIIPASASTPAELSQYAVQLTKRESAQIQAAFDAGSFEMMSAFVWAKSMAALREQLRTLGVGFIGEMLGRPDITDKSVIHSAITDYDALRLAKQLGMIGETDSLRLRHAMEMIQHFTGSRASETGDDEESMSKIDAAQCLLACVKGILAYPELSAATGFTELRAGLEAQTFQGDEPQIKQLLDSSYFFWRTMLTILLALIRRGEGAQLQHALGNFSLLIPAMWTRLRKPERWNIGLEFQRLSQAGKPAAETLRRTLIRVHGFDFVPESARSDHYIKAAQAVLDAHRHLNNFYNEPGPMKALASLGSTIPMPSFPICMTAALSVKLGNRYGNTWQAQDSADAMLSHLSQDNWEYYLSDCLPDDEEILEKLTLDKPVERWFSLFVQCKLHQCNVTHPGAFKLWQASCRKDALAVSKAVKLIAAVSDGGGA